MENIKDMKTYANDKHIRKMSTFKLDSPINLVNLNFKTRSHKGRLYTYHCQFAGQLFSKEIYKNLLKCLNPAFAD